jgi:hypothetical protein
MNKLLTSLFLILSTTFSFVALGNAPKHATIEAKATAQADGTVSFSLKVIPNKGMKTSLDAPWKLNVLKSDGLTIKTAELKRADLDGSLPGFSFATVGKPASGTGKLDYKMTAFICTEDKTQCYRDVLEGSIDWKAAL